MHVNLEEPKNLPKILQDFLTVEEPETEDGEPTYNLDFTGMAKKMANADSAIAEKRKTIEALEKINKALGDRDLEEVINAYEEFQKKQAAGEDDEDDDSISRHDFDKFKSEMESEREKEKSQYESTIVELKEQIKGDRLNQVAKDAINEGEGYVRTLLPHVLNRLGYREDTGDVFVRDEDEPDKEAEDLRTGAKLSPADLVNSFKSIKEFAGSFPHESAVGSGSNGSGSTSAGSRIGRMITLTREDAADPAKYRAAKARAAEEGVDFKVEPPPS